jgi:hypothetical protein
MKIKTKRIILEVALFLLAYFVYLAITIGVYEAYVGVGVVSLMVVGFLLVIIGSTYISHKVFKSPVKDKE